MTTTTDIQSAATTVMAIYEAFGRGDIPTVLGLLAADVVFEDDEIPTSAHAAGHPLLSARRGGDGAAAFFTELGACTIHSFELLEVIPSDTCVAARVRVDLEYPGGGRLQDDEMHLWYVENGEVTWMRHYADTGKHLAAWGRSTRADGSAD